MKEVVVTAGDIRRVKLQSNHHHQKASQHFLQAGSASCCPTNSVRALKKESITFHGLSHPKLTWGFPFLSLTTKGCGLLWGEGCRAFRQPSDDRTQEKLNGNSLNMFLITTCDKQSVCSESE